MAAIAAFAFGAWFVLLDLAAEGDATWALVASRASASVFMVGVAAVSGTRPRLERGSVALIVVAGQLDVTGNALFVLARGELPVGLAAAMSVIYPIVTMLLARFVGREALPRLGLIGVLLAVVAVVLISVG
jgi:drug/metabolite transporter (DMT)-like permease